ncbi:MAG: CDP-diacylglycerol--glycerol-3-phosphate 3-phosphatidyltransferase [Oscillospiraceae bacterium]
MNLPNRLTMLRVVLIPFFVLAFLMSSVSDWIALVIFVAAGFTDFLDGEIARKQNIVTDFGKLMDPLADKLMITAALVCFTGAGLVHPAVTILIISREMLVTGLRTLAVSKGKVIAADFWGKFKTVSQDVTIILILIWQSIGTGTVADILGKVSYWCIWIMTILTLISAVNYCIKNKELFMDAAK